MDDRTQLVLTVVIVASLVVAAFFLAMITRAGHALRRTGGPGIVPFELAESPREADRIMRAWGPGGRAAARRSIGWDFGFIVAYVVLLGAAALHVASRADVADYAWLRVAELAVAGLAVLVGVLDTVENLVLLAELRAHDRLGDPAALDVAASARQVAAARKCARVKFGLAGAVGIAIFVGFGIVELSGHPSPTPVILAMIVSAAVAGGLYLGLGRRKAAAPDHPPSTTGLAPDELG
jgi:hypothetical protein